MRINEDFFDDIKTDDIEVDKINDEQNPEDFWSISMEIFADCNPSDFIRQRGKYKEYMSSLIPAIEKYFTWALKEKNTECEFIWAFIYQNKMVYAGDSYKKKLYDREFCIWWDSADNSGRLQLIVNFKRFEFDNHLKNILFLIQMIYGVFFKFDKWITTTDPIVSLYCKYTYPDIHWRELTGIPASQFKKRMLPKPLMNPIKNPKMWCINYGSIKNLAQDFTYEDMLKIVGKNNDFFRLTEYFNNNWNSLDICRVGVLPFDKEPSENVLKLMPHNAFYRFTMFDATRATYAPINTLSWDSIYNNQGDYSHLVNEHMQSHGGVVIKKFEYGNEGNTLAVIFDGTIKGDYNREYILMAETNAVWRGDEFSVDNLDKIYA